MAQRRYLLRLFGHGLLALASFFAVSSWIRVGIPWSETLGVRARIEAFSESKDDFDAIYIGSSSVLRAFRPDVIDPLVSESGKLFRSYNLGMPGMWSFESQYLLEEIVAQRPAKLRWAIVEAPLWKADHFSAIRRITDRSVRWHTPALTVQAWRSIWLEEHPAPEKLRVGYLHLTQLAMRTANYALGPSWWRANIEAESPDYRDDVRKNRESSGYAPLEAFSVPGTRQRKRDFQRNRGTYLDAVRFLSDSQARGAEMNGTGPVISMPGQVETAGNSQAYENYNLSALSYQRSFARSQNLNLLYFVLPEVSVGNLFADLHRRGALPMLFDYKSPSIYPGFYTVDSQFDFWHMSQLGAKRFSDRFARDFLSAMPAAGDR